MAFTDRSPIIMQGKVFIQERQFNGAWQEFQRGRLIWSGEGTPTFWVLYADGTYDRFPT